MRPVLLMEMSSSNGRRPLRLVWNILSSVSLEILQYPWIRCLQEARYMISAKATHVYNIY